MVVGAFVGFGIGQAFDGTAIPLTLGALVCGVVALGLVAFAEGGPLFRQGQPADEGAAA